MTPPRAIGVLALQGDFALHVRALGRAGASAREVRAVADLGGLDAIVLPGGESTAMLKLMEGTGLEDGIRELHRRGGHLFGTCAGLILLARSVTGPAQRSLGLLDVAVKRNAWGRQVDSFEADLALSDAPGEVRGVFIRAPRITDTGPGVEVLARIDGEAALVREGRVLASTFHPEMTDDLRLHRYFLARLG